MRQLLLQVPKSQGDQVAQIARDCQGVNLIQFQAQDDTGPVDVIVVSLSNRSVEKLLAALEAFDDVKITFAPQEVLALRPSRGSPSEEVTNLEARSPIEVFLGGLQSIGSWKGFLGYAAAAGIIVWIGMFTNSVFLLIAAMLIAPFAGPAMNAALATARGDWKLLRLSLVRYVIALWRWESPGYSA